MSDEMIGSKSEVKRLTAVMRELAEENRKMREALDSSINEIAREIVYLACFENPYCPHCLLNKVQADLIDARAVIAEIKGDA